jgi:hypothetical protein
MVPGYVTKYVPQEVYLDTVGMVYPVYEHINDYSNATPLQVLVYLLAREGRHTALEHYRAIMQKNIGHGYLCINFEIARKVSEEEGKRFMDDSVRRILTLHEKAVEENDIARAHNDICERLIDAGAMVPGLRRAGVSSPIVDGRVDLVPSPRRY